MGQPHTISAQFLRSRLRFFHCTYFTPSI